MFSAKAELEELSFHLFRSMSSREETRTNVTRVEPEMDRKASRRVADSASKSENQNAIL